MKFLVDAQLPPALAQWLSGQGHEARHVEDEGLRHAEDGRVWSLALHMDRAILTKDEDFPERAARDPRSPVIIWLRVGNTTNRALLAWFEPRWPEVLELLRAGNHLIEVR